MAGESERQPGERPPGGVWEYLRRRSELDREIQSKFARPVTIMFTDIKGSTTFFDLRGDIEGISMLQRHNVLVFPIVERTEGRVVKQMGDGLMVTFSAPANAVRAAVEIQRALADSNRGRPEREQIHLRIGINAGMGIVEEQEVYGDVVNAAARVQGLAEPDQILITEPVYTEASQELGSALFLPVGASTLRGKLEAVVLYEVAWSPEQTRLRAAVRRVPEDLGKVFVLEVSRLPGRLKVSGHERREGEEDTLRAYAEWEVDETDVDALVVRMGKIIGAGDQEGRTAKQDFEELARLGELLYTRLLPPQTREKLAQSGASELLLVIDDQLVQIPWELLHDGREFLCLRLGIGRVVSTAQPMPPTEAGEPRSPLRVAIVADPQGDLPDARREGAELASKLGRQSEFQVVLPERAVNRQEFLTYFTTCDILHIAGHAEYDPSGPSASTFLMADGALPAAELRRQIPNGASVPRLIFFNACETGRTPQWKGSGLESQVFGFANAILLAGVKHYIGSLRRVHDRAGFEFALEFYRQLGTGRSIGVAVRETRRALVRRYGQTSLTWASYVLYGDPASHYLPPRVELGRRLRMGLRTRLALAGSVAGLVMLAAGLFWTGFPIKGGDSSLLEAAYRKLEAGQLEEAARDFQALVAVRPAAAHEGLAAVALRRDELARAESLCADALRLDSRRAGCLLIQGDLRVLQGDLEAAARAFEALLAVPGVAAAQQSAAYNRLGRLAAEQGQTDRAAEAYRKAQELDPRNWESLSNLGALLRRQGQYAEAVSLLERATALRPDDPIAPMLLREARDAEALTRDRERQRRIDALVEELTRRYKRGEVVRPQPEADAWTSRPLTLSLLGLESRGRVPFREGEHEFFLLKLAQVLEEQARVRLVERTVLEKLLDELKLGTSALADPQTALRLGRLLSARLIAAGGVAVVGTEWQLTFRVIETETSAVTASFAQSFPLSRATRDAAELVGKQLSERLRRAYPLRARVVESGDGEVVLNIGAAEGALPGLRFQLFDEGPRGRRQVVAEVELLEIQEKRSRAKVLSERMPIVPGLKALQLP